MRPDLNPDCGENSSRKKERKKREREAACLHLLVYADGDATCHLASFIPPVVGILGFRPRLGGQERETSLSILECLKNSKTEERGQRAEKARKMLLVTSSDELGKR